MATSRVLRATARSELSQSTGPWKSTGKSISCLVLVSHPRPSQAGVRRRNCEDCSSPYHLQAAHLPLMCDNFLSHTHSSPPSALLHPSASGPACSGCVPSPLTKDKLFLFISGAGLVTFGHHPRKTGSVLACMFLLLEIPGAILELDHSSGCPL